MTKKAIISTHDGREATVITKASNVLFEDGQTAQDILNDRQDTMITPIITTSTSMSKVGQGDSVDYSENVVDGAYESCILKGNTKVNLIQDPSSKDVVLPYEFADGQYVTINDTKESGALGVELKGQTLVNSILSIDKTLPYTWASNSITSRACALRGAFKTGVYALIVEFGEVLLGGVQSSQGVLSAIQVNYTDGTSNSYSRSGLENYSKKRFFTTFTINKEVASIEFKGTATQYEDVTTEGYVPPTVTINKIMIIEYQEGMENWDIPYFEGMASCKMPILRTVGKNLFDGELITGKIEDNGKPNTYVSTMCMSANYTRVQPNTTYNYKWIQELNSSRIFFYDANKNFIKKNENAISSTGGQFTTPSNCYYILFHLAINTNMASYTVVITESDDLTYEPYKSSILSLPEEVALRGIPNSNVYDTLNLQTGVYTQNVLEYTLNGSESYTNLTTDTWTDEYMAFLVNLDQPPFNLPRYPNRALASSTAYVEGFNYDGGVTQAVNREGWYIGNGSSPNYLGFRIKRSRLTEYNDSPREWIRANNIRILLNIHPIVTKINLSSTLKSWNTTTHIYSEIPENTLYPILSHSNPTYPVILKPSTKYSIIADSYSNGHTNSPINFNLGGATASTTVGNRVTTITTPSTLSNELLTMSGRGNKLNNVMVIEGDVVGDEPYFEGMCDSKSPILSNVGKNLFDWEAHHWRLNRFQWSHGDGGLGNGNALGRAGVEWVSIKTLKLKPSQTYYTNGYISFYENDGKGLCIDRCNHTGIFTVPTNAEIACVSAIINDGVKLEYMFDPKIIISEIEMEYEPYKSNILSCNGDKIELTQDMFEQEGIGGYSSCIGKTYEEMKLLAPSEVGGKRLRIIDLIRVKPNTTYRLHSNDKFSYLVGGFDVNKINNGKVDVGYLKSFIFTTSSDTYYIAIIVKKDDGGTISITDFQDSKLMVSEIDKTIVLRSLPNGVCDTLNVETGEYVQRISEVMLDGSEDEAWGQYTGGNGNIYYGTFAFEDVASMGDFGHQITICDKLKTPISNTPSGANNKYSLAPMSNKGSSGFTFSLNHTETVAEAKKWLQANPITVQYLLKEPIVKTVDLSGYPFSYENGHVILSSGSIEQSLTPIIEYSVPTNRNGQIRSNQKMVERHQKELDKLQAIILANLINSQYQQTLTTLKYELSRV